MAKKKKQLSGAAFLAKMAAGKAAKARGLGKEIRKIGTAAGGVFGLKLPKKGKRKNTAAKKKVTFKAPPRPSAEQVWREQLAKARAAKGSSLRKNAGKVPKKVLAGHKRMWGGAIPPGALQQLKKEYTKKPIRRKNAAAGKRKRRGNPEEAAAARYEFFHGKQPEDTTVVTETVHEHSVLSGIGKLEELKILSVDGRSVVTLKGFKGALLSQDEEGTQLYIKGGDQKVNLKEFGITKPHASEVLGACEEVAYFTDKRHLRPEDGGVAVYHHKFGKKGSRLPIMIYDVRNQAIHFVGGGYDLPEVGIRG